MADAPSTPRVRAHRERRSLGVCSVQVRVDKNSIDELVRLGGASPFGNCATAQPSYST